MFQTGIHLYLQQHLPGFLIQLMQGITLAGTLYFFVVLLCVLVFGLHFRKGFLLLQVVLWGNLFTILAKEQFLYPRPYMVDNRVEDLDWGMIPVETPFSDRGAEGFWQLLPEDVVTHYRSQGRFSRGFPSGHTSVALAFWTALALLFPYTWVRVLSLAGIVLIPFSRVVLGVHFLADLAGGYVLGALVLGGFYLAVLRPDRLQNYLTRPSFSLNPHPWQWVLLYALPLAIWAWEPGCGRMAAYITGSLTALLLLPAHAMTRPGPTWWKKGLQVLLAIVVYVLMDWGLGQLAGLAGIRGLAWADFIRHFLVIFVFIWGSVTMIRRLGDLGIW